MNHMMKIRIGTISRTSVNIVGTVCHKMLPIPTEAANAISTRIPAEKGAGAAGEYPGCPRGQQEGHVGHRVQRLCEQPHPNPFAVGVHRVLPPYSALNVMPVWHWEARILPGPPLPRPPPAVTIAIRIF